MLSSPPASEFLERNPGFVEGLSELGRAAAAAGSAWLPSRAV